VNAVLYAALAAAAGIAIVAVGGGGSPRCARWEATLARYDAEKPNIGAQAAKAPSAQAEQLGRTAQDRTRRSGGTAPAPSKHRRPQSPTASSDPGSKPRTHRLTR